MSRIEWCDITINPVVGCSKCSPGCDNCYAEKMAFRLSKMPQTAAKYAGVVDDKGKWTGRIRNAVENEDHSTNYTGKSPWEYFWNLGKKTKRIFVGSMTDVFHENTHPHDIAHIMHGVHDHPEHTFILLTKRPHRMREEIPKWLLPDDKPLPNLWLGITVCNQEEADVKVPMLLHTPAAIRFVSIEPMLGPVDIGKYLYGSYECALSCGTRLSCTDLPEKRCTGCGFIGPDDYETWGDGDCEECPKCGRGGGCGEIEEICPECGTYMVREHPDTQYIDWVIAGPGTGPGKRPAEEGWFRSLRDQCRADYSKTPFFLKKNVGGSRLLDGVEHSEVPHA